MNKKILLCGIVVLLIGINSFGQNGILPDRLILGIELELSFNQSGELIADVGVTVSNSCVEIILSEKPIFDTNNNTYYIRMNYRQPDLSDEMCLQVVTTFRKRYNLGKQLPGTYTVEVAGDAIESIEIPENKGLCGDYNEDGEVNIIDGLKIAMDYVGYPDGNDILGDVDSNGYCNIVDALLIAQYIVTGNDLLLNCDFTE